MHNVHRGRLEFDGPLGLHTTVPEKATTASFLVDFASEAGGPSKSRVPAAECTPVQSL